MFRTIKIVGLLTILSLAGFCPSMAQVKQTTTPQSAQRRGPVARPWGQNPARTTQPSEFQGVSLDREMQLPNLPGYTGKQIFVTGVQYPNATGGPGYFMIFNTEHTESQVREWWTNALKNEPWKIEFRDARSLKARAKDGSKCAITAGGRQVAAPEKMKGMNGSYTIYYHPITKK